MSDTLGMQEVTAVTANRGPRCLLMASGGLVNFSVVKLFARCLASCAVLAY